FVNCIFSSSASFSFFFDTTSPTVLDPLSLHDALPILIGDGERSDVGSVLAHIKYGFTFRRCIGRNDRFIDCNALLIEQFFVADKEAVVTDRRFKSSTD